MIIDNQAVIYKGQWKVEGQSSKVHGHGIAILSNGDIFKGHFENGMVKGFGTYFSGAHQIALHRDFKHLKVKKYEHFTIYLLDKRSRFEGEIYTDDFQFKGTLYESNGCTIKGIFSPVTQKAEGFHTICWENNDSRLEGFLFKDLVVGTHITSTETIVGCFVYPTSEWVGYAKIVSSNGDTKYNHKSHDGAITEATQQQFEKEFIQHLDQADTRY